jgi:signal transduction histidine kinase
MPSIVSISPPTTSRNGSLSRTSSDVRLEADPHVGRRTDAPPGANRYGRPVGWRERQLERLRSLNPLVVDAVLAVAFTVAGVATVFGEDLRDDARAIRDGFREPGALVVVTALVTCAPIAFRRRSPLVALGISSLGILVQLLAGWPAGTLPLAPLLLTYTVGAWCALREAIAGLGVVGATIVVLGVADPPGFDTVGVFGVLAQYAAVWAIAVAIHNGRAATDARVREAEERAEADRQTAARVVAEERLRIAQELHDVVAHSMSVIAVQAGVGAHVLDERPEHARSALEAISATSRGTLNEMRRLLGVLRDSDGGRSAAPAPGLDDLPQLVDDVRAAGMPATLRIEGIGDAVNAGVALCAYPVVQEALTNVMKHAGKPTRVAVTLRYLPGTLGVEVVDDGRPLSAQPANGRAAEQSPDGSGPRPRRHARAGRTVGGSCRLGRRPAVATGSRRCCHTVTQNDRSGGGRRRPGARAQRLHDAAVRRARYRGRRRGEQRRRGSRPRRERASRRDAARRAPAGDGRARGDPPDHREHLARHDPRRDPHDVRSRRVRPRGACAPGPAGSCSRTPSQRTCSPPSGSSPPATP